MTNYTFISGNVELLESIRELWIELNEYHANLRPNLRDMILQNPWEKRRDHLLNKAAKGKMKVDLCRLNATQELIGYCVSSIVDSIGEIDSIYIKKEYRRKGIGHSFMEDALAWIKLENGRHVIVEVGRGNESVFLFYERFGLFPRRTVLTN